MRIICFALTVSAIVFCTTARAEVTFEIVAIGGATDISADGSVVVGNTYGDYETFRWTEESGVVPLGRATVPVLGGGAGTPDVSADGTRISATILGEDGTYGTQGLWTLGSGWQETMPPTPPGGGLMNDFYGSAWGLSHDGGTVVGFYWRPGQPDGGAHATAWTEPTGVVDLGSSGGSSRANDANGDGSVVVGWVASPVGTWQPTVWVDGSMTILNETPITSEASVANPAGTILAGQTYDDLVSHRVATVWRWNGLGWDEEVLGAVSGTFPNYGTVYPHDMTPDGSMIVGYNAFDWAQSTGFIWTEDTGMVDVEDYLSENGITVPISYNIRSLTGMSDDGTVMVGCGSDTYPPWVDRWFIIRTTPTGVAETPHEFAASQLHAYPNPTRGATRLALSMRDGGDVDLRIYDLNGRLVKKLLAGSVEAGQREVYWDGRDASGVDVASGIYFCRLATDESRETLKITVLR